MNKGQPKSRFFYGWVVVTSCFVCCFSYGLFCVLGVFFTALQAEFGWSSALTSSIHSIHMIVFAFSSLFMGWLVDRHHPRVPIILGAVLLGVGFSLLSCVNSLGQFYLLYGFASLETGIVWVVPIATARKWFVRRSGLALGITATGIGVGTLVYSPLASHLICTYGWRTAYIQLGIGTTIVLLLASLGFTTPERKGLMPYGAESQQEATYGTSSDVGWSIGKALLNKSLWLICAQAFCAVLANMVILIHFVPFAECIGIEKTTAAWAWGLVGGISIFGRIITPTFLEGTIGWRKGLLVVCIMLTVSLLWISRTTSLWMLFVFVIIYGFSHGGRAPLLPALIGLYFGNKSLGQLIGFTEAMSFIGGAIGPILAGYIVDITNSYTMVFLLSAVFFALAAFLALLCKPPLR